MNPVLHCAVNYWLNFGEGRPVNVALLCERDEVKFAHLDAPKMFEPWSKWFHLKQLAHSAEDIEVAAVDAILVGIRPFEVAEQVLRAKCINSAPEIITPSFTERDSWADCVIREIAHHDFEHGGLNEWDGVPTKHSQDILRMHSRTQTRTYFPFWAFNDLPTNRKLRAIDLGCGPVSHLRWGAIQGFLDLVLVDPLLPVYEIVLARHGLDRLEGASLSGDRHVCVGEDLAAHIPADLIELVFTSNALDHTKQPAEVVNQIATVLKRGGRLAVGVATHEGTKQKWDQFHKTDIYVRDDRVVFNHQNGPVHDLLSSPMQLERIVHCDEVSLTFTAVKV